MSIWIILLLIFLFLTLVLVIWVFLANARRKKLGVKELNYIHAHWIRIIDSFNHDPKHAILDADKLLDYALKRHGFEGNLGEKLKKAKSRFSDLDGVWSAHKLRNKIAHELTEIDKGVAKRALKNFKRALNDLGAQI